MGYTYTVTGYVTTSKKVSIDFTDDGKSDLEEQARKALKNSTPLNCTDCVEDVEDIEISKAHH